MTDRQEIHSRARPQVWEPPTPQLIRGPRMLIVGYRADPNALAEVLPPGLEPHPNGLVQMNMYQVAANQTSGFGAFTLTYLTVEIAGYDSDLAEGAGKIPGRYFAYYWNSSPRVRSYVRENVGAKALPGNTRTETEGGKMLSILNDNGRDVIRATASVTNNHLATIGGHLNYYAHREFLRPDGGAPIVSELVELPLPFIADVYDATLHDVTFDFPDNHPAARLRPLDPFEAPSVLYADVTFTYSMGRTIKNYL